jgi:hypothetical protein
MLISTERQTPHTAHPPERSDGRIVRLLAGALTSWFLLVILAAQSGALALLPQPAIAGLVALGVVIPTLAYAGLTSLRDWIERLGLRAITLLHVWRIPAGLLFFWYGAEGSLPPAFWIPAGIGDVLAGLLALRTVTGPQDPRRYWFAHLFGAADFLIAVGSGLTHTLLLDPRMQPVTELPLALVPLFGVGLSGATHLIAFHLLSRGRGLPH